MADTYSDAGFQSQVGRAPTADESSFYAKAGPGWQTDVQNAMGGGAPTTSGHYGEGYQTPAGQTNYGTPAPTSQPQVQPGGAQQPQQPQQPATGAPPAGNTPSYYNSSDPVQQAVWQAFQAKGITPRDQGDFQYWVDHINQSGGLANGYASTGGTGTWAQRMAAASGGVGDYGSGGGGGTASSQYLSGWGGAGSPDPRSQALYDQLLKRSTQSLKVNPNDQLVTSQVDPYRVEQNRNMRSQLSQAAEASGPNGNIGNETRMAAEHAGENTAAFQGQVMQREVDARRQEIAQALSGQLGVLSLDQQAALHREDEALQARGQNIQSQLGNRSYDIQDRSVDNAANQQAWQNQYTSLFG